MENPKKTKPKVLTTKQKRYWKASAWILERKNPEASRLQNPDLLSLEQVKLLVTHLSSIVVNEVKSPAQRKKILDELEKFLKNFGEIKPAG